jgi:small subunit ribosomal protein S17
MSEAGAEVSMAVTEEEEKARGRRKVRTGKVISDKMDKTVTVSIDRLVLHKTVHKYIKQTRTFHVHDEKNECKVGDTIRFTETRPLSKLKRWRFLSFVERAK